MHARVAQTGFTLVELVTVILILGLLAVTIVPRFLDSTNFDTRTVEDQLISALRQAQQLAMVKPLTANVQLQTDSANNRIRIQYSESGTQTIDVSIDSSITLTNSTISFEKTGNTTLTSQQVISISPGSRQVCVETTGYAYGC